MRVHTISLLFFMGKHVADTDMKQAYDSPIKLLSTQAGAHKRKERVTSMLGVMKHCQGFCGVW